MKTDYYPLYDDSADRVAELSADDEQHARDLRDSKRWYSNHDGWGLAEEQVSAELEEMVGTSDIDKLDDLLGTKGEAEADELSDLEQEARDLQDRAEWYDEHGWDEMAEREYDRLKRLKEGT
jgi:hypothetical protein